ncbi:unnamed protein product [Protopolystoma xenopodis]|uniref:Uncharacterized protein n=1 Tax=Protopolystoma xenopodis TaxID=117903 RepID=A0A3S5A5R5_9PLAT|nr:unnamed protein product [Protopolystoma xenopodis]
MTLCFRCRQSYRNASSSTGQADELSRSTASSATRQRNSLRPGEPTSRAGSLPTTPPTSCTVVMTARTTDSFQSACSPHQFESHGSTTKALPASTKTCSAKVSQAHVGTNCGFFYNPAGA